MANKSLTIPNKLKIARERKGMSQNDAARALGIGQSTLSQWEVGARRPKLDNLRKMASLYVIDPQWLLFDQSPIDQENMVHVPVLGGGPPDILNLNKDCISSLTDTDPDKISAIRQKSNQMEPLIKSGSYVFFDTSIRKFVGDGIYVLWLIGFAEARRLYLSPSGQLMVAVEKEGFTADAVKSDIKLDIAGRVLFGLGRIE